MTDAYNVAIDYLRNKYGKTVCGGVNVTNKLLENSDDKLILTLLRQYNSLSNAPKVELELKLTSMNIPFEKRYT